jgi:hypothetical protein
MPTFYIICLSVAYVNCMYLKTVPVQLDKALKRTKVNVV